MGPGDAAEDRRSAVLLLSTDLFLARKPFTNAFLDWTSSNASSHEGLHAEYGPKTDGTRNLLKERIIYTAAWTLDEVLPNIPKSAESVSTEAWPLE